MRKYKFKQVENYIHLFEKLNEAIYTELNEKSESIDKACEYLEIAQKKAIELGTYIEEEEGQGHATVTVLEKFCEIIFDVHKDILSERGLSAMSAKIRLENSVKEIKRSADSDIKITYLAVFLPYKASMWDSLETVWMAADADPDCQALVIPIPYHDKNPDGSIKETYWEGEDFPDYVPITKFEEFDFGKEHPDMIFIHNPYDDANYVTSIHPFFYSDKIKQFTDCLVYIPYFATSGSMSEGQALVPAYANVDLIVVQSEKFIGFYDESVDREKFLPFGSPKFDSVIQKCKKGVKAPAEWREKLQGKKVFFYNTSLNGMLANTRDFMKKMNYVFDAFRNKKDVCLIWRPHPLFEKTLASIRPTFLQEYLDIRDRYIEEDWGIYDVTPSIEDTIALCDAYLGDSATSVTSLFGVVGKPLYILNNAISSLPDEEDYELMLRNTTLLQDLDGTWHRQFLLRGRHLLGLDEDGKTYKYLCDYTKYDGYYNMAYDYKGKLFIFPSSAQDVLVVQNNEIKTIKIDKKLERACAFFGTSIVGQYAFIWPQRYPDLVIFDMEHNVPMYLEKVASFNVAVMPDMERVPAVRFYYRNHICVFNVFGNKMLMINLDTFKTTVKDTGLKGLYVGITNRRIDDEQMWLIPYEGTKVVRFNMETFEHKEYDIAVDGLEGFNRKYKEKTNERLFSNAIVLDDKVIFAPNWGNKFVELSLETEEVLEWESPFDVTFEDHDCYIPNFGMGSFSKDPVKDEYRYYYAPKRQWYKIDMYTKEIEPLDLGTFDKEEFINEFDGFVTPHEWLKYCCMEEIRCSIEDMIAGNIPGHQHNKDEQIKEFADINASVDGDCGEKVYQFIKSR